VKDVEDSKKRFGESSPEVVTADPDAIIAFARMLESTAMMADGTKNDADLQLGCTVKELRHFLHYMYCLDAEYRALVVVRDDNDKLKQQIKRLHEKGK
jgi:hypothetical protein